MAEIEAEPEAIVKAPATLVEMDLPLVFSSKKGGAKSAVSETKSDPSTAIDDVLNSILPPREFVVDDVKYIQYVSKKKSTRSGVNMLQENLDSTLLTRQARRSGICPVREDLYSQTFDELIRQVALNCPERGLLLLRMRDEIRMTIDAYKTLYGSSVTFGVRKQLQAEQGMEDLEIQVKELSQKKANLDKQRQDLLSKVDVMEKRNTEQRIYTQKKRKEEIAFMQYQGEHFNSFLKTIQAAAKPWSDMKVGIQIQ